MPYSAREANGGDVPALGKGLEAYMREVYRTGWGGNLKLVEQHITEKKVQVIVVETHDLEIVGFAAWIVSYDLHWCVEGGEVIDLFVYPAHRGLGPAILLIAKLAADIQRQQGVYVRGAAVASPIVQRLYAKVATCLPSGECYISGRAFRHLAGLSGKSPREIFRNLPETAWNSEP